MKPQDILFILLLIGFLFLRKPKIFVLSGLFCLLSAMPLFAHWIFFTAERLVMYAAGFLLVAIILLMFKNKTWYYWISLVFSMVCKLKTAGNVIEKKEFQGWITVEKLAIKPEEPAVDSTYYQNLIFR